jgi:hypothetical protein
MRSLLVLSFVALAFATEPIEVRTPPPAPTKLAPRKFDATAFAGEALSPRECEHNARTLRESNANDAWSALVACATRNRWPRGDFTELDAITSGFWDDDLQSRPDAPWLIARVIALRGGDVEGDVVLAQKARVPIFTLAAALRQPDVYKGRWVLVRGSLEDVKGNESGTAGMVHETSLRGTARDVDVGYGYSVSSSSSGTVHGSGESSYSSSRYGKEKASGSGSASYSGSSTYTTSFTKKKYENEKVETGRLAVGKLPQADPFLEPGKEFIFLARFDGVKPSSDADAKPVAVMNISAYYKPNALLIQ